MALSWDDFRLVKAVADCGGLTNAAAALGINHSTAFRRLAAIEGALDARLFERSRSRYVATAAGLAMVEAAARMEADVSGFERAVEGQVAEPAGQLRITAPFAFATGFLMPLLAEFRARFPAITLDLIASEDRLNLARRDADVAFRASSNPPANLIGRRLSGIAWALYGRRGQDRPDLGACDWIGLSPDVDGGRIARFIAQRAEPGRVVMLLNAVPGLMEAVEAGIGVSLLPCILGDGSAELERFDDPELEFDASLWLLTHPDLRHSARVRAIMDFMAAATVPLRPILEGRALALS